MLLGLNCQSLLITQFISQITCKILSYYYIIFNTILLWESETTKSTHLLIYGLFYCRGPFNLHVDGDPFALSLEIEKKGSEGPLTRREGGVAV